MKQFNFSGIVGWDVTAADLRKFLDEAGGDDVEIVISSPGGYVGQALEMYNALRRYAGKVTARLAGYAMSAASYIPLAAERIIAEDNAVYMIHNVHGGVFGDHNYILKYGRETEALSRLLATAYARHTGRDLGEVRTMMDEETYLYGDEIVSEGFAHELADTGESEDKENILTAARTALAQVASRLAGDSRAAADDLAMAVALAGTATKSTNRAAAPATPTKEQDMDLKTLKKEHPDLVAAVIEEHMAGLDREKLNKARPELAAELTAAGAQAEVERIKDVRAQLIPGHESLIATMELDGESTGADAAKAIIQAERDLRNQAASDPASSGNAPVEPSSGDAGQARKMSRADFNNLSPAAQRAYIADGGTVQD